MDGIFVFVEGFLGLPSNIVGKLVGLGVGGVLFVFGLFCPTFGIFGIFGIILLAISF